jgi:hypothetical protein
VEHQRAVVVGKGDVVAAKGRHVGTCWKTKEIEHIVTVLRLGMGQDANGEKKCYDNGPFHCNFININAEKAANIVT